MATADWFAGLLCKNKLCCFAPNPLSLSARRYQRKSAIHSLTYFHNFLHTRMHSACESHPRSQGLFPTPPPQRGKGPGNEDV